MIHPTAIISSDAVVSDNVEIGPYCVITGPVKIGANCKLKSHVVIDGDVTIGEKNQFFPFSSIGMPPQDLGYKDEPTKVEIGDNNIFRENVTVHRGTTKDNLVTKIGHNNFLMNYVHVGHDCIIGNNCIIINSCNLGGHVVLGDRTVLCGGTSVQQFSKIGKGCYIGGGSAIDRDIPPFITGYGNRFYIKGINIKGLTRDGFEKNDVKSILKFFNAVKNSDQPVKLAVSQQLDHFSDNKNVTNFILEWVDVINNSKLGFAGIEGKK